MLSLYTETAFEVTPATAGAVVDLQVPRKDGSYDKSKYSARPKDLSAVTKDEETFVSHVLASESSLHVRQSAAYPRSFLWRLRNSRRVLEIQCADTTRSEGDVKEAYFTLRFQFQDPVIPRGIALTDLDTTDELQVFVCTSRSELFSLRLPTNAFRDPEFLNDANLAQWRKILDISTLGIDTVHHVWASSPLEVFISYISGRLQRLTRRVGDENWKQDNYDDRTWGASIRSMVTRRGLHMIDHGSQQIDPRTTQAMTTSPDGKFLFTVCLNHTLRVWNLLTGQLVSTRDLLDAARDPHDRTHLNPAENALLQVFKPPLQRHPILLTFTPRDGGQFKFWDVTGGATDSLGLQDKYPTARLTAPDPDPSGNTIWSMVGFKFDMGNDFKPAQLWVLWRNHNHHQLYNCQLDLRDLPSSWKSGWVKCATSAAQKAQPPHLLKTDSEDPASLWLDFFFWPGRYSEAVLETALSIFEEATSTRQPAGQRTSALRQRMCSVVAANVALRKYNDAHQDYERFYADTDSHWRNLYRIVENINDSRNAPLSLTYDSADNMAWIAMADQCCAVRECSDLELLQLNDLADIDQLETTAERAWTHRKVTSDGGEPLNKSAAFIAAARTFRQSFPPELDRDLALALEEATLACAEHVTPTTIYNIFDGVNFGESISNEAFDRLDGDLDAVGGLAAVNSEMFFAVLELFPAGSKKAKSTLRNTLFGNLLLAAGSRDMIGLRRQLVLDLLALAIFVEGELNQEDTKLPGFDSAELVDHLLPLLKICDQNLWLLSHSRKVPLEIAGPDVSRRSSKAGVDEVRWVSIFEDCLSKAVRPLRTTDAPLMFLITEQLAEIDQWASGKDTVTIDEAAVHLQCDMLARGQVDLATAFLRFQPTTAWSSYVKGRLGLANQEYEAASVLFQKASYSLACGKALGDLVSLSAGLLSIFESECFNNGLPSYLHHVTTLFESAKAYNEASQFAHLTLSAMHGGQKEPMSHFHAEVLSRLFNAELQLSRYDHACNALLQMPDPALQKSSVTALVSSILGSRSSLSDARGAVHTLLSLPWAMHPVLAQQMDHSLASLAKGQTSASVDSVNGSSNNTFDYLSIMYALRIAQKDFRGAVTVLYDRLRSVRRSGRARHDPEATLLRQVLLSLINTMSCMPRDEAYIIVQESDATSSSSLSGKPPPRKKPCRVIVTLHDLRKEYQDVLDRCSRIERGDFDFEVDGESDDDEVMVDT